jgi:membrane associated rhomboid family serine protease
MHRNRATIGGLPPFRGSLRNILIFSTVIYLVLVLLRAAHSPLAAAIYDLGILKPETIKHGWLWQLLTYGFIEFDPLNFLLTMLSVYFIGSAVQERLGGRAFLELYLSSLVGAGILGFIFSLTGVVGTGFAYGAGAAANAVLMVFYLLNREAPIMIMFIPIPIPAKYLVIFTGAVEAVYLLLSHFSLFYLVLLLGLASGYLWYRFGWRRIAVSGMVGKPIANLRNSYHRWKRRRAGKKFQVYMKKHNQDPSDYFDEHGNFRPPDEKDKNNGGSTGGWVN